MTSKHDIITCDHYDNIWIYDMLTWYVIYTKMSNISVPRLRHIMLCYITLSCLLMYLHATLNLHAWLYYAYDIILHTCIFILFFLPIMICHLLVVWTCNVSWQWYLMIIFIFTIKWAYINITIWYRHPRYLLEMSKY